MSLPYSDDWVAGGPDGSVIVTSLAGSVKYDANGNQKWVSPIGGRGAAIDNAGNIYLANDHNAKLSSAGSLLWTASDGSSKVRMDAQGKPVFMRSYYVGVGPDTRAYVNIMEVDGFDAGTGTWIWGFKHVSGTNAAGNALVDFYVRPGYIAFSNGETDSALYSGSWLASVCDAAANPPALARACVFTPV